jgi:hypothetical protein
MFTPFDCSSGTGHGVARGTSAQENHFVVPPVRDKLDVLVFAQSTKGIE